MPKESVIEKMQKCIDVLGVPLKICWIPTSSSLKHGEIKNGTIFLYDRIESETWKTFTHEIIEYRLQKFTRPYRMLINGLIDVIEKLIYEQKEELIESIPLLIETIDKSK